MKQPTFLQRFFAARWLEFAWVMGGTVLVPYWAVMSCEPSLDAMRSLPFVLLILVIAVTGAAIGFLLGAFSIPFLLVGLLDFRAKLNGAPFEPGDWVQILVGPHRGRVVRIRSTWQGNTFRVDLGEEAAEDYKDIFSPLAVCREDVTEQEPP